MHRTRIKICGITRPDDALAAVHAGADAIGMILHANAPRRISQEAARSSVNALPDEIETVGVFVDADPKLIVRMSGNLDLDQVQLHGTEPPEIVSALPGLTIIKAIRLDDRFNTEIARWRDAGGVRALLLEAGGGRHAGGNGIESDWNALAEALRGPGSIDRRRLVIAGGLRPDNVAQVVQLLQPWCVDVSSGVESELGVKSIDKLRDFCRAVRAADQAI
jgi:phosphoribosylanthranilate isomerase